MSTLIVQLPARSHASLSQDWHLSQMPFVLLDADGATRRSGSSALSVLPRARVTVLMLAATDVVALTVKVPDIKGVRLRQALPNLVEEHMIGDAQRLHIALDARVLADGARIVYAVDRAWFKYLFDAFLAAGHLRVRMVPLFFGIEPLGQNERAHVLISALSETPAGAGAVFELAVRTSHGNMGLAIPASDLGESLKALFGDEYALAQIENPSLQEVVAGLPLLHPVAIASFESVAKRASAEPLDLCQFEFEQAWKLKRGALRRWRLPLAWALACLVAAVVGVNVQWALLSQQRDALQARMNDLLTSSFPRTTVILDAPLQMTRQLDALRVAAGELSPSDFLSQADALARALAPIAPDAVQAVDYAERGLNVTFKPGTVVDRGFVDRLAANGLDGRSEDLRWFVKVRP